MKIEPKAGAYIAQLPPTTNKSPTRDRAIAMLQGSAPQGAPNQPPAEVVQAQAAANTSTETIPSEGQGSTTEAQEAAASTLSDAEAPATEKKEAPLSSQYAVLARKEKQLRIKAQQQELAYKGREEALKAREAELARKDTEYKTQYVPKERLTQDTINVLLEQGLTHDQIAQQLLNQPTLDPATQNVIRRLEAQIAALEGKVQETSNNINDEKGQNYETAVSQIRSDAKALIKIDPAFETIRETDSAEDVVSLIVQTYEKDGIMLTLEEAAQTVEEQLVEEAMKIARIKKIQQRLTSAAAQTPKQGNDPKKPNEMKTLTNAVGTARQLTARERALAAFEGKLNKG